MTLITLVYPYFSTPPKKLAIFSRQDGGWGPLILEGVVGEPTTSLTWAAGTPSHYVRGQYKFTYRATAIKKYK